MGAHGDLLISLLICFSFPSQRAAPQAGLCWELGRGGAGAEHHPELQMQGLGGRCMASSEQVVLGLRPAGGGAGRGGRWVETLGLALRVPAGDAASTAEDGVVSRITMGLAVPWGRKHLTLTPPGPLPSQHCRGCSLLCAPGHTTVASPTGWLGMLHPARV